MRAFPRTRGSALMTVVLVSVAMAIVLGGLVAAAIQSYRLSKINEARSIERAVAESELEAIYFEFKYAITTNKNVDIVPSSISGNFLDYSDSTGSTPPPFSATLGQPVTIRDPYLFQYRDPTVSTGVWKVKRSLTYSPKDRVDGKIGSGNHSGHNYYMTAEVEVIPPAYYQNFGVSNLRIGRQLVYSVYTVLQYSLFYQGDLEMVTGTSFDIKGDISVNGNIYMGVSNNPTFGTNNSLNIFSYVNVTGVYNQDLSGSTTFFKPLVYTTPVALGTIISAPNLVPPPGSSPTNPQIRHTLIPDNFMGGLDVAAAMVANPALFPDQDSVYRAIITPPPKLLDTAGNYSIANIPDYGQNPPTEDPTIANVRLYNMASLIVTIDGSSISVQEIGADGKLHDASSQYAQAITAPTKVFDAREGQPVQITNIDVGALSGLKNDDNFQGVVYVNQVPQTAIPPAVAPPLSAIRLINGASTPQKPATATSDAVGFTVATNGGMYVQGDYNSATPSNPSVLLADAVTALSAGWNDANAADPSVIVRKATGSLADPLSMTINAAIMTGNTSATPLPPPGTPPGAQYTSGGAQNLVRYLEDWRTLTVNITGSIGRLFEAKYFTGNYKSPGDPLSPGSVYQSPTRNIVWDANLAKQTPKGAPSVKSYSRGAYFNY